MRSLISAIAMKLFIVLTFFVGVYMISCTPDTKTYAETVKKDLPVVNGYQQYVCVIDSCEYLVSGTGNSQNMCHKGNCKFCAERRKKELVTFFNELRTTNQKH